ncbi:hypothetical protein GCM10011332_21180 [Terasakiella brassicae]|uniref:Uncharacterized protein n=1 Tax=Terasakiella brassicae TaxID=1634917 RepID=A0A917C0V2_9PROT|nr:hypothetical protein [Terasakiella brassicae]GGF66840.1 hypothetical protein GCM10011332_21180 [Terasakiella brassicae]
MATLSPHSVQAFEAPQIDDIIPSPTYWDSRRKMMEGGKVKRIADECQRLVQHHSDMAERANGWLYRFAVPYGGDNGFIDRPTHGSSEKRILRIHGWLLEENRWEKHGAAIPGALGRCQENYRKAIGDVMSIMSKFGAVYDHDRNDWTESWLSR